MKEQAASGIMGIDLLVEDVQCHLFAFEFGSDLARVQR